MQTCVNTIHSSIECPNESTNYIIRLILYIYIYIYNNGPLIMEYIVNDYNLKYSMYVKRIYNTFVYII